MFFGFFGFKLLLAEDSVRNRVSKNVTNLGDPETLIQETDGDQTVLLRLILETDAGSFKN